MHRFRRIYIYIYPHSSSHTLFSPSVYMLLCVKRGLKVTVRRRTSDCQIYMQFPFFSFSFLLTSAPPAHPLPWPVPPPMCAHGHETAAKQSMDLRPLPVGSNIRKLIFMCKHTSAGRDSIAPCGIVHQTVLGIWIRIRTADQRLKWSNPIKSTKGRSPYFA